jgi:two-component system sensor histidine kinase ChvG
VRPLVRLRRTALALADRRATPGSFASVTRRDEIGDLARTLEELTTRLDAHIKLLESFAADVAHEFKNPLASIRTAAELAATTEDAVERQRLLAMLVRDVDRLERLVTGVRELARIDTQLAHDALQPIALGGLLRSIVSGVELQGRRVALSIDGDAAPLVVRATEDRLVQVFENLLQNAVSFSPPESAIDVAVRTQAKLAVVQIADRGPGIPEAHLDRVFERFFTYRPNDGSRREHTGLGLAIARAIVEGYGGVIQAGNRDGGGAVFEVRLPLAGRSQAFSGHAQVISPASDVSGS